jgi:hypothetical protein
MSEDKPPDQVRLLPPPAEQQTYDVGYAQPPVDTRFRKGQSGNPRGRPRGAKNRPNPVREDERLKAIILQEAYRTVTINDAKGRVTIPMAQAIVRSLAVNAAKGLQRSQRLFTELLAEVETSRRQLNGQWFEAAVNYKVEWERELARRARLGITGEEPLPHPDHVVIDLNAGTAYIRGPATKEEKHQLERWRYFRGVFVEELAGLLQAVAEAGCDNPAKVEAEIARTEKAIAIIDTIIARGRPPTGFPDLDELSG